MKIHLIPMMLLMAACASCETTQTKAPQNWDGLELVERKGLDLVYVRPGATLAQYRRVMVDPVEISFDKNWKKDMDQNDIRRVSRVEPDKIRQELAEEFEDVMRKQLQDEGRYALVDTADTDVLRVRPAIVDLYINAPDTMEPGRSYSFVVDAGRMTLIAELRDSTTNALLARVVDREEGSDMGNMQWATKASNTAEARRILTKWATALRTALDNAQSGAATAPARSASAS